MNTNSLVGKALQEQVNGVKQSEWFKTIDFEIIRNGTTFTTCKGNKLQFQEECKKKLKEQFVNEWRDLGRKSFRKIISMFRCSDNKLEIEIGRHNKIPRETYRKHIR